MEPLTSDPNWLDHVQAWSTVAATIVAGVGLIGIFIALQKERRQSRVEAGPYIRVDIFPNAADLGDFEPPKPHFETTSSLADLVGNLPDSDAATFSACFRNYQPHPLGIAFRVAAFFVLEFRVDDSEPQYRYSIVTIPYVEHNKPVQLDLFRIPRSVRATVWLSRMAFSDFYDGFHEHSEGSNENALHGRLTCFYDGRQYRSIPEGRPAGEWGAN